MRNQEPAFYLKVTLSDPLGLTEPTTQYAESLTGKYLGKLKYRFACSGLSTCSNVQVDIDVVQDRDVPKGTIII